MTKNQNPIGRQSELILFILHNPLLTKEATVGSVSLAFVACELAGGVDGAILGHLKPSSPDRRGYRRRAVSFGVGCE